jgi:hypothetical protein
LGRCHNGREILNQARPAAKLVVANVLTGLATIKPASAPPIMAGTKPQKGAIAKSPVDRKGDSQDAIGGENRQSTGHRSHFWASVFELTGERKRNLINVLK